MRYGESLTRKDEKSDIYDSLISVFLKDNFNLFNRGIFEMTDRSRVNYPFGTPIPNREATPRLN